MTNFKAYNLTILFATILLSTFFISSRSSGRISLVSVSGCSSCEGSVIFPRLSEEGRVKRLIARQGLDPEAFTLARGVAGDFWISGAMVCTADQGGLQVRCHKHFQ